MCRRIWVEKDEDWPRLSRAHEDLDRWRTNKERFDKGTATSPQLASVLRAIDSAFKAEISECRIRMGLNAQAVNESRKTRKPPHETATGRHLADMDWWLTEAALRALHAGIDAVSQLLNVVLDLREDADARRLPQRVALALAKRPDLKAVSDAASGFWMSPACRDLCAFVNHVKHAGFPERTVKSLPDSLHRSVVIERFFYEGESYGRWTTRDIETMIDGFRQGLLSVIESVDG